MPNFIGPAFKGPRRKPIFLTDNRRGIVVNAESSFEDEQNIQTSPLKVLVIVGDFPPIFGGCADYTALFAEELVAVGVGVTVLTTIVQGEESRSFVRGVDIRRRISEWRLSELRSILKVIDETDPATIVHLMYGGYIIRRKPMVNLLPLLLRVLRPRRRVIVTLHEFRTQRKRYRIWALPMIMAAHGLIFVDEPDREPLLRWTKLKRPKMVCIPISSNILPVSVTDEKREMWRQRLGITDATPVVTFFGGVSRQKGLLDLLHAINELQRASIPGCLLIVGWFFPGFAKNSGYEREVREGIKDGIAAGWIKLVEKCPPEMVSEYLHASDVVVLPFARGARSNNGSLLAAIVHGLPVLTTEGPDTPVRFAEEYGVALVPSGNPSAFSARLKDILLSEGQRQSLKTKALQAAKSLSWSQTARKAVQFYRSL